MSDTPSHSHLKGKIPKDLYDRLAEANALLLQDAVHFIQARAGPDLQYLVAVLDEATVHPGMQGLDMACALLRFTRTASGKALMISYTWDWLHELTLSRRADAVAGDVMKALDKGELRRP